MDRTKKRISAIRLSHRKDRERLKANLKNRCVYPIEISDLPSFQVNGLLSIEAFKENIAKLFPLVLSLVSEGHGIRAIERLMGMNERSLEQWLQNNPSIGKKVIRAREIRRDSIELKKMME